MIKQVLNARFITEELEITVDTRIRQNKRFTIHYYDKKWNAITKSTKLVTKWFKEQATNFFNEGIVKLVSQSQKCLDVNEDYVKK